MTFSAGSPTCDEAWTCSRWRWRRRLSAIPSSDLFAGDLPVFRGARGDLVKILWNDGLGLSLYAKRLERAGSFSRRRATAALPSRPCNSPTCSTGSTGVTRFTHSGRNTQDRGVLCERRTAACGSIGAWLRCCPIFRTTFMRSAPLRLRGSALWFERAADRRLS